MQITIKRLKEIIKEEVDYFNQLLTEQAMPAMAAAPGGPPPGMGAPPAGGPPSGDPLQGAIAALEGGDAAAALQILKAASGAGGMPPGMA